MPRRTLLMSALATIGMLFGLGCTFQSRVSPAAVSDCCCCCCDPNCVPGCCAECPPDCKPNCTAAAFTCPLTGEQLPCEKCCPLNKKG